MRAPRQWYSACLSGGMATPHLKTGSRKRTSRHSELDARHSEAGVPSHSEVAALAYRLYLSRGGGDGHDLDDWFEAERLLGEGALDSVFALYERATI